MAIIEKENYENSFNYEKILFLSHICTIFLIKMRLTDIGGLYLSGRNYTNYGTNIYVVSVAFTPQLLMRQYFFVGNWLITLNLFSMSIHSVLLSPSLINLQSQFYREYFCLLANLSSLDEFKFQNLCCG